MKFGVGIALAILLAVQIIASAASTGSEPRLRMWELVEAPEWNLMVRSIHRQYDPLPNGDGTLTRPVGQFAILTLDLTNLTNQPLAPASANFLLEEGGNARSLNLAGTPPALTYATENDYEPLTKLVAPGETITTVILFDIDDQAGKVILWFLPTNQPIQIDECKCDLPSPMRTVESLFSS